MITHKNTPLFAAEKFKLLTEVRRGQYKYYNDEKLKFLKDPVVPNPYEYDEQMSWFTKDMVLNTIKERWDFYSFYIKVNKILWNSEFNWFKYDKVDREETIFDMSKCGDLDDLVGYLFQAPIEGYTIRYVSTDTLTGIYLQKSRDFSTNIDEEVLTTLVDVVNSAVENRKPREY